MEVDDDGDLDEEVVGDNYYEEQGLGTIDVDGDPSDVQLLLDSMACSSDNFFEELGVGGDDREANRWKYDDDNLCNVVLLDHVDKRNLDKVKELCDLTIEKAKTILGITRKPTMTDCIEIFIHRDWYFLMEGLINSKLAPEEPRCTVPEVLEVQRMWMLQMIEKQTSQTLFRNDLQRWGLVKNLVMNESRYTKLIKSFKTTINEVQINADSDVDEETDSFNASAVWGNLLEQDELPRLLEEYVGKIGRKFVFDGVSDCTIDDDKLRHSSRGFRSSGIAMSGFRGSRIGPVMNGLASVQTGLLHAIHFNRFGDNPITIVTALLNNINYGNANYQKNKLDISISIDRGYNYGPVTDVLTELGTRFIGTHSEKFDK